MGGEQNDARQMVNPKAWSSAAYLGIGSRPDCCHTSLGSRLWRTGSPNSLPSCGMRWGLSLTAACLLSPSAPSFPWMPCLEADIEDPYDCKKCRMSFSTLQDHRKHIHEVHSKEYHPCPTCGKIFSAPSMLERHVVTHVGGKPFSCGICNKAYQVTLATRSAPLSLP